MRKEKSEVKSFLQQEHLIINNKYITYILPSDEGIDCTSNLFIMNSELQKVVLEDNNNFQQYLASNHIFNSYTCVTIGSAALQYFQLILHSDNADQVDTLCQKIILKIYGFLRNSVQKKE